MNFTLTIKEPARLNIIKDALASSKPERFVTSPHMMLALLLYCCSHGIFSSRKIERATYTHASIHKSIRYDRAFELELELTAEISQLLKKAEDADSDSYGDDDQLKGDLKRLEILNRNLRV